MWGRRIAHLRYVTDCDDSHTCDVVDVSCR